MGWRHGGLYGGALTKVQSLRLYTRYEARLGAVMMKTLGQAALQFYTQGLLA